MGKAIAIIQSSYIPWKGYFDIIHRVDEFVLLDDVQFTRRDWRNRNRIKTAQGLKWLTIPVASKGLYEEPINRIRIRDRSWRLKHWETLRHAYAKAPCFREWEAAVRNLYETAEFDLLSEVNHHFLTALCAWLGIRTPLRWSSEFDTPGDPSQRLLAICQQADADTYLSGPAARGYLDVDRFRALGVDVAWMDYAGYPEYRQAHPPFEHGVTVLDLLFHVGREAPDYIFRP